MSKQENKKQKPQDKKKDQKEEDLVTLSLFRALRIKNLKKKLIIIVKGY